MSGDKSDIMTFLRGACVPNGHCYTLVLASFTKRLLAEEMPDSCRIEFLQHLDKMTKDESANWLNSDMIAALEPMCDRGYEMVLEAQKLGPKKALDAYAKFFPAFAALNPSFIDILKMSPMYRYYFEREASEAVT
jgi:hypothetical protein